MKISRRMVIGGSAAAVAGFAVSKIVYSGCGVPTWAAPSLKRAGAPTPVDAHFWQPLDGKKIKCVLCPRECSVADAERGFCGVRENNDGKYYTLVYGRPSAVNVDPIEKKPLFHYLPGTTAFSIGTAGCNFECKFCQNWNISQFRPEDVESFDLPPDKVVEAAQRTGCATVACTYNEPVIFYEYVLACATKGHEVGVPAVMISNGFIQKNPMVALANELGAIKIDLKSFSEKFYAETCRGKLQPVLDTLKTLKEQGIWFEIVVLLVTTLNDSPDEVKRLANWVATTLSPDVPLHFSRYFPFYKLQLPQTPVETMEKAYAAAKGEGCNFVYVGNIELPGRANTLCPGCGAVAIKRVGMMVVANDLKDGKCPKCGRSIPGVWKKEDAFRRGILA